MFINMARNMLVFIAVLLPHGGDAPIVLAVNDYDALGRLVTAKLPGETVSYGYQAVIIRPGEEFKTVLDNYLSKDL